jgi:casein kinase 1
MELKIGKHFKMNKKIGNGAFGEIYEGQNVTTKEFIAIKLEPISTPAPQLEYEHNLYKILQGKRK